MNKLLLPKSCYEPSSRGAFFFYDGSPSDTVHLSGPLIYHKWSRKRQSMRAIESVRVQHKPSLTSNVNAKSRQGINFLTINAFLVVECLHLLEKGSVRRSSASIRAHPANSQYLGSLHISKRSNGYSDFLDEARYKTDTSICPFASPANQWQADR